MKPIVKIIKRNGEYCVEFSIGRQSFDLAYKGTKTEANWMAKMLKAAFKNLAPKEGTL